MLEDESNVHPKENENDHKLRLHVTSEVEHDILLDVIKKVVADNVKVVTVKTIDEDLTKVSTFEPRLDSTLKHTLVGHPIDESDVADVPVGVTDLISAKLDAESNPGEDTVDRTPNIDMVAGSSNHHVDENVGATHTTTKIL